MIHAQRLVFTKSWEFDRFACSFRQSFALFFGIQLVLSLVWGIFVILYGWLVKGCFVRSFVLALEG